MSDRTAPTVHCWTCLRASPATADVCAQCGTPLAGALRLGSVVAGRYEIVRPLGGGGMGIVFEVRDRTLDETVALKVLRSEYFGQGVARFRSEIKLARRVAHRNVARIFEYGEDGRAQFIVMELLAGETLRQRVAHGPLPPARALEYAAQAADGLGAIHEAGIVHRDVKAPNLMLTDGDVVKVMDFGIAKSIGAGTGLTDTGVLMGTPEYMSPEQAAGRSIDGRSDLYSLGVVLFEMLAGEPPFRAETPIETLWMHIHQAPRFDTPAARAIPAALQPVLRQLLAKSPDERPATAPETAVLLRAAAANVSSMPAASASASESPARLAATSMTPDALRRRSRIVAAAAVLVMIGLTSAIAFKPRRGAPPPAASPSPVVTIPARPRSPTPVTPARTSTPAPRAVVDIAAVPTAATESPTPAPTRAHEPRPGPTWVQPTEVLLARATAALRRGDIERAKVNLDAVLARGDAVRLPVARERRLGVDRWTLVLQPGRMVTTPDEGLHIEPGHLALENDKGEVEARALLREVVVEEKGRSPGPVDRDDRSEGGYVRLGVKGAGYTLYFVPRDPSCRVVQRLDTPDSLLQCNAQGLAEQEFVAAYVSDVVARLGKQTGKR
jgi:eukaryotic-like serine/threonine-protein kinase